MFVDFGRYFRVCIKTHSEPAVVRVVACGRAVFSVVIRHCAETVDSLAPRELHFIILFFVVIYLFIIVVIIISNYGNCRLHIGVIRLIAVYDRFFFALLKQVLLILARTSRYPSGFSAALSAAKSLIAVQ